MPSEAAWRNSRSFLHAFCGAGGGKEIYAQAVEVNNKLAVDCADTPRRTPMEVHQHRALHIGRLTVIEWLSAGEKKTGKALVDQAKKWPAARAEYYPCIDAADVLKSIREIAQTVPQKGPPILHVEAHGKRGQDGGISPGLLSKEFLRWRDLREPLRQLNISTKFNLIVFGAACYGNGFLWEIARDLGPAAFVCCIGFANAITPSPLLRITKEFYRAIFVDSMTIDDAIASAMRESFDPTNELLAAHTIEHLLRRSIGELVDGEWRNELADRDGSIRQACEAVVSGLLAYTLFPENRARFPFDVTTLLTGDS